MVQRLLYVRALSRATWKRRTPADRLRHEPLARLRPERRPRYRHTHLLRVQPAQSADADQPRRVVQSAGLVRGRSDESLLRTGGRPTRPGRLPRFGRRALLRQPRLQKGDAAHRPEAVPPRAEGDVLTEESPGPALTTAAWPCRRSSCR